MFEWCILTKGTKGSVYQYILLIACIGILMTVPSSAATIYWYNVTTEGRSGGGMPPGDIEPNCQYRYIATEETFSQIRNGLGVGEFRHPNYTLNIIAGTTSGKFVNMTRCMPMTYVGYPVEGVLEDVYIEFIARVNTTLGPFSIGLTSGNPDGWGSIDKDEYEKFDDTLISDDRITFNDNGTYNVTFRLNEYGKSRVVQKLANQSDLPLYVRFGWDIDNNFDGVWTSGGIASMSMVPTDMSTNVTRVMYEYSLPTVRSPFHEVASTNQSLLGYHFQPQSLYGTSGIVRDSVGTLYIAYYDKSSLPTTYYITIARSTDNGTTWVMDRASHVTGSGNWGNINLMIDQYDRISVIYGNPLSGGARYRNYSVSGGFGNAITVIPAFSGYKWSAAIDSQGIVHVVWAATMSDNLVKYRNISTLTLAVGNIITVSDATTGDSAQVMVDSDDNVHMVWGGTSVGVNGNGIMYRNFTYGGTLGNLVQTSDVSYQQLPLRAIVDQDRVIHAIYLLSALPHEMYYVNTSAGNNFVLSSPLRISTYTDSSGNAMKNPTFALDKEETLHFLWSDSSSIPYRIMYRNITANGLGAVTSIDTSLGGAVAFSSLYGYNPVDNTPTSSIIFNGGTESEPYRIFYGEYPIAPGPTLTPYVNPFNTVTIESTAQTVQMIITLGILLSILAVIAMLIMRFIGPSE